jgi:putative CocE/NonD family hydrolase
LLLLILVPVLSTPVGAQDNPKVSRLGAYSGYSQLLYSAWVRTSQYVSVRDGTKIAVDVIRPEVNGKAVEDKLPVLLIYERYQRADMVNGKPITQAGFEPFWSYWLKYGYVIASADVRGGGASYGTRVGDLTNVDSTDAYDVIQWLADQPWSSGNVGMMGVSYNAITQFTAAGAAPPALKAMIPQMAMFDLYSFVYPGGIYRYEFLKSWAEHVAKDDKVTPPVPVDADTDGAMARAAVQEHMANASVYDGTRSAPYRDSVWSLTNEQPYFTRTLNHFAAGINKSNVAVYQIAGWYDMWPDAQALWFNNLTVPERIVFTPFSHGAGFVTGWQEEIKSQVNDPFTSLTAYAFHTAEHLRFFDHYLKGIDNGIDKEPPIWYYTMGAPTGEAWRSASQWPLPDEKRTNFYLEGGKSDSIASVNDGLLDTKQPSDAAAKDEYTVDYSTTTGAATRWHNGHGGGFSYGDMTVQGKKSLTYTTAPLSEALEITGHPVVHLWVTANADDADFFVYLEEVDADGYAHYISEGMLRASHRALDKAPYNNLGLPWHRSYAEDLKALPKGEPVELVFDLLPTSNIFDVGHRIRIRMTGADVDSYLTPKLDPAPVVTIFREAAHASYVDFPVIPAK